MRVERQEGVGERWRRRSLTIPAYLLAAGVVLAMLPALVAVLGAWDLATDRRLPRTRCALFAAVYLACESAGLLAALGLFVLQPLLGRERYARCHHRLQRRWASTLFGGACRIFGFRLRVAGEEAVGRGPVLVLVRHASVADTLLPAVLLSGRRGLRLRYVLKRELLWDPCLDVVGQRIPNVFVRRGAGDSEREIGAVRRLASDLGDEDGVLIYPEGTRFTPAKQARRLADLEAAGDDARLRRVRRLQRVLPPRLGGPLALIEQCPSADVLVMAHVGFDGVETFGDTWSGALIGREVRVKLWRIPAGTIPSGRDARGAWLDDVWCDVDAFVRASS